MDGFQGIDLIHQEDGMVTRIAPVRDLARECNARNLAKRLRREGNNAEEAFGFINAINMVCYRPMLKDEELKAIIDPIFTKPLIFSGLDRNRQVLELFRDFKKRGIKDDEIVKHIQFFNSRCCNPPLPEEDLNWIMKNNAYMAENKSYFQVDKELSKDGKTVIKLGETVNYRG